MFNFDHYRRPEMCTAHHGAARRHPARLNRSSHAGNVRLTECKTMTDTASDTTEFTLNGTPVSVYGAHPHLLAAFREELDVTSPKDGCSPSGQCGCCTVHDRRQGGRVCQQPLDKIDGRTVVTLEGVDAAERDAFANAFAACGGLQCGFCIPGIVMRAKAQIDKKGADLDPRRR